MKFIFCIYIYTTRAYYVFVSVFLNTRTMYINRATNITVYLTVNIAYIAPTV